MSDTVIMMIPRKYFRASSEDMSIGFPESFDVGDRDNVTRTTPEVTITTDICEQAFVIIPLAK